MTGVLGLGSVSFKMNTQHHTGFRENDSISDSESFPRKDLYIYIYGVFTSPEKENFEKPELLLPYETKEALPRTILINKPSVYPIDQGGRPSLGSSVSRLCALAPITLSVVHDSFYL